MNSYQYVYKSIGLSEIEISLFNGTIRIPRGERQPAVCYGFPPAILPMWSNLDSMIYSGYWKHWFCERESCYVSMFANVNHKVNEISKNIEQLSQYLVLNEIVYADDITKNVDVFASKLEVKNISELDSISIRSGDNPQGLLELNSFRGNAPLICFEDQTFYKGDFPHIGMKLTKDSMFKTCSLELTENLEEQFLQSRDCPEWYKAQDKNELFYKYLNDGEFSNAWFTLNSNGWLFSDVKIALTDFANRVDDKDFHSLVEAWCSIEHCKLNLGGY